MKTVKIYDNWTGALSKSKKAKMTNHPNRNIRGRLRQLMSEPPTVGHFIAARVALKMTQAALAEALDMSPRQVQYMEAGAEPISQRTWYSLILLMAVNRAIG